MTSFLTSILSAITRRWVRPNERPNAAPDERPIELPAERPDDRLLALVSSVPAVVWEAWGSPGAQRLGFISEHVTRMLGYTVDECLAMPDFWLTVTHPDDRGATNTFRCITKNGRVIHCESHATAIHDDRGVAIGMRGITIETAPPPAAAVVVETPVSPDLQLKQVLVVDREQATLDLIGELLRQYGARVTTARSAAEAILALHEDHDLVITDGGMSVAQGVSLAQQLRQANGGLPAIVLRKPVDPIELAGEIARLLNRSDAA